MNPEPVSKDEVNVEINTDVQQQNKKKEAMPRRQNPDSHTCPFARLNIMTEHLDHAVSRTGYLYQTLSLFWSWPQLPSATLPMLLPALYINGPKCWGCLCFTRAGSLGALKNTKHLSGTKQRRLMIAGKRDRRRPRLVPERGRPPKTQRHRRMEAKQPLLARFTRVKRRRHLPGQCCCAPLLALYLERRLQWCRSPRHSDCPPLRSWPRHGGSGPPRPETARASRGP